MTEELVTVSFKLPVSDLRRIPDENRSRFYRDAVHNELERREAAGNWNPKSPLVRKMSGLRAKYLAAGGETLDPEGIARELRDRRGGLA